MGTLLAPLAAILSTVATTTTSLVSSSKASKASARASREQKLATAEVLQRERLAETRRQRVSSRRAAGSGQTLLGGIETPAELGRNTLLGQ